jgi:signal transduction histidine kinase
MNRMDGDVRASCASGADLRFVVMKNSDEKRLDHTPSWQEQSQARRSRSRLLGTQGRLMLAFCAILFAALGVMGFCYVNDVQRRLANQLKNEASVVAASLAGSIDQPMARTSSERLQTLLAGAMSGQNVVEAAFYDERGQLRASTNTSDPAEVVEQKYISTFYIKPANGPNGTGTITVPASHNGKLMGYARVEVSMASVEAGVNFATQLSAGIACCVVLVALPVTWLLVRSMFGPIRQMQKATQRIMSNEQDVEVLVTSRDAVGQLAQTFNELVKWVRQYRAELAASNHQLAEANRTLEGKIEARTLQLESANSRLAGEIAEKEDFLRAVSHDLNAPLRNIGGMVSMMMLKNKDLPPDAIQRLERIKKNVEIETDLINELLELSRIKTRRGKFEEVETEKMIWDLRGLFENDLRTRQIELVLETSLPNLFVDKARIRQVFQNLIDNAIKYMGERPTREIRVGCTLSVTEAQFYVRDTGTGIHPEDLDKVFFIFRRGRSETTQKTSGKGIGLASVKSIIETYSGKIWVESKVNEGTTFFFTINGNYVPRVSGKTIEQLKAGSESEHEQPSGTRLAA